MASRPSVGGVRVMAGLPKLATLLEPIVIILYSCRKFLVEMEKGDPHDH